MTISSYTKSRNEALEQILKLKMMIKEFKKMSRLWRNKTRALREHTDDLFKQIRASKSRLDEIERASSEKALNIEYNEDGGVFSVRSQEAETQRSHVKDVVYQDLQARFSKYQMKESESTLPRLEQVNSPEDQKPHGSSTFTHRSDVLYYDSAHHSFAFTNMNAKGNSVRKQGTEGEMAQPHCLMYVAGVGFTRPISTHTNDIMGGDLVIEQGTEQEMHNDSVLSNSDSLASSRLDSMTYSKGPEDLQLSARELQWNQPQDPDCSAVDTSNNSEDGSNIYSFPNSDISIASSTPTYDSADHSVGPIAFSPNSSVSKCNDCHSDSKSYASPSTDKMSSADFPSSNRASTNSSELSTAGLRALIGDDGPTAETISEKTEESSEEPNVDNGDELLADTLMNMNESNTDMFYTGEFIPVTSANDEKQENDEGLENDEEQEDDFGEQEIQSNFPEKVESDGEYLEWFSKFQKK